MISPASPRPPVVPIAPVESFIWTCAGGPIRIVIPLTLISRLRAVANGPGPDSARESEVGGILLGAKGIAVGTVEIRDCVRISRSQAADGHYALDPFELAQLRREKSPLRVVGYFRTQPQGDPRLRGDELGLVRKYFPDPSSVVLLIRTSVEPYSGGFLFWSRNVFLPASLMDFPFDVNLLAERAKARPVVRVPVTKQKALFMIRSAMAAAIGLALIALTALATRGRWLPGLEYAYAKESVVPTQGVALQLERLGSEIDVRWNPEAFKTARGGHMEIREEQKPVRRFPLDRERLADGHFRYRSSAQRLDFRLEVVDKTGSVVKGTALAVSSMPPDPSTNAVNQVVTARAITGQIASSPAVRQPQRMVLESPKTIVSTAPKVLPAAAVISDDPGEQKTIGPAAAFAQPPPTIPEPALKTGFGPAVNEAPIPTLAVHLPAVAPTPPARPVVFHPPVATRKVQPVIDAEIAERMRPGAEIQVLVNTRVNAAGRVVDAHALPDPSGRSSSALYARLGLAATDAAKRWRFEPALLGTTPVPGKHVIRFVFKKPDMRAAR